MEELLKILKKRKEVHLTLNALGYFDDESQKHIVHCLELDLVADGNSPDEAVSNLIDVIKVHLEFTYENDNWDYIFHPAPPELWAKFAQLAAQGKKKKTAVFSGRIAPLSPATPSLDLQLASYA